MGITNTEGFSGRLKMVRERSGLTQVALAALGGVSTRTQQEYEGGRVSPKLSYLAKLATAGFDITFLLAGVKASVVLNEGQAALLENYEKLPDERKDLIVELLAALQVGGSPKNNISHSSINNSFVQQS